MRPSSSSRVVEIALLALLLPGWGCKTKDADASAPVAATPMASPKTAAVADANGVPAAASAAAPAASGVPAANGDATLYAVFGVKNDDVLNVRAEPNVTSKKVYSFGPTVKSIHATGQHVDKDRTPWIEVSFDGGTGWINRLFVTEAHPGGGCNDPALTATIRAFMRAVTSLDGAALAAVSSPLRGLLIRQEVQNPTLSFGPAQVPTLFTSPAALNWGVADGTGAPITGTFKAKLLPGLTRAVTGKGAHETCGKLVMGGSAALNNWPPEYAALTPVSFNMPAEPDGGRNNWVTWVAGIEYVDGKPYVATLVQYQWEI